MGLFNILSGLMNEKRDNSQTIKRKVPLDLHQGTAVELPELDIILAKADGGILPDMDFMQTINAVGEYHLFNKKIYNCYLNDKKSHLRLTTKDEKIEQMLLFVIRDEVIPVSTEDWEFWLGKYQKDSAGEFVRDSSGVAIMSEVGLIGWPQFQVDYDRPILYDKSWVALAEYIEYTENVYSFSSDPVSISHSAMEYNRKLNDTTHETLFVSAMDCDAEASVNIAIGIELKTTDLKIFPA